MTIVFSWAIRGVACVIALVAILWIWMMLSAGMSMGWSDRSGLRIATLIIFGLLMPTVMTVVIAAKAIYLSKQGHRGRAVGYLTGALFPIPLFYPVEMVLWR